VKHLVHTCIHGWSMETSVCQVVPGGVLGVVLEMQTYCVSGAWVASKACWVIQLCTWPGIQLISHHGKSCVTSGSKTGRTVLMFTRDT